jgi:M6 family metalloprotease-like protein
VLVQPGGDTVHCFASGDEYYHWLHDTDNFTIIQDPSSGYFVYALLQNGMLVPSGFIAGTVDPRSAGLVPGANVVPVRARELRKERNRSILNVSSPQHGVLNNLIVFIRFSGEGEFPDSVAMFNRQFNDSTPAVNSMINYFREVSYNTLTVRATMYPVASGAFVVSFQDSHTRSYFRPYNSVTNPSGYTNDNDARLREHALLRDAVSAISSQVPSGLTIDADGDGDVDNVCFIVSGSPDGWGDLLWPHMWSLYSYNASINGKRVYEYNLQLRSGLVPSGVGVLCHELSHTIGFPDLYRYVDQTIDPVSSWDLMCADLNPPQHVVAYQKMRYGGWIDSIPTITQTGVYTLHPLRSATNNCYKIASPNTSSEYFVVEYRKEEGTFETSLPGSGLLVYRINTAANGQGNANGPPDEVYIYRPGGTLSVNGIPSRAYFNAYTGRTRINDATNPSDFLSTGAPGGIDIRDIGIPDTTISFKVTMLEPLIELTGSTINFGTLGLGYSRVDSLIMSNPGRESLYVSSIVSGDGNFLVSPSGAVLAPSESRTVTVTYTPVGIGVHSGTIVFTHNATGSPDTVVVSGVCEVPTPRLTLSQSQLSFGTLLVDSLKSDSVTVTNTGTGPMNVSSISSDNPAFGVTPSSFSLAPSSGRTVVVTFHPGTAQAFSGSILLVHDAAGSPDSVSVSGTGVLPSPLFLVSPSTLTFGVVQVDSTKTDSVTISNSGNAPLTVISATSGSGPFSVLPESDTIPASGSSVFHISFHPLTGGLSGGAIVFIHDASGSPDTVTVSGTGALPEFVPAIQVLSFDEVLVGSAKNKTFAVSNPGYAPLVVTSVSSDNDRFTVTPGSVTIAALGGRVFQARFSPDSQKVESANVIFVHNGAGSPDTIQLTGIGSIPHPVFSPSALQLDFGNVDLGTPETDSLLVTNTGTVALQIDSTACDDAHFTIIPDTATIAPSASRWFAVTFSPDAMGPVPGNLIFSHNAEGLADTIPLAGTGVRRVAVTSRWNMVSVPVMLPGMERTSVFPASTSSAFGWGPSGYEQTETLATGSGYWIKFGSAGSVDMQGTPIGTDSIAVAAGWNVIGSITNQIPVTSMTAIGTTVISQVFGYNGGYSVADSIKPGRAYWVRVDQPGNLVLTDLLPEAGPATHPGTLSDAGFRSVITISDAGGNTQTLYLDRRVHSSTPDRSMMLPPPPPRGGFDVCFAGRKMVGTIGEDEAAGVLITINDATYPITVDWIPSDGNSVTFDNAGGQGDFATTTMLQRGSFTISDPAVTQLRVSTGNAPAVPASVILHQNYPNPFNPVTIIRYELPVTGYVSLRVYNILGQEVATLIDGMHDAGNWTARFDSRDLPSGHYTYVLRAGESRLAKTMLVIK